MLLERCRICRQDVADIVAGRALGIVGKGLHRQIIVIAAILNDGFHRGKRLIVAGIHDGSDIIGQLIVGYHHRCRAGSGKGRLIGAAHNVIPDNTGKGCNQNDKEYEYKAYADQDLEKRMPHRPCSGKDRTPGAARSRAGGNFRNRLTAFHTGLHRCGSSICRCFSTFDSSLLGSLF